MRFEILYKGLIPKELSYPDAIEDCFAMDESGLKLALCDGASESFDSRSWARLLSDYFTRGRQSKDWFSPVIKEYLEKHPLNNLSWSKQAAFERGSFSTLLRLELYPAVMKLNITALGDTVAVLTDGYKRIETFPYKKSEEFQQRPYLLSTNREDNVSFYKKIWKLNSSSIVICMTDALAEWAFRSEELASPVWDILINIRSDDELIKLVQTNREQKKMRVDDASLIVLSIATE
jgi:predicted CopG family antitoxin